MLTYKLIQQENLNPKEISRIYVGTESGVDASKPVARMFCHTLEQQFGSGSFDIVILLT